MDDLQRELARRAEELRIVAEISRQINSTLELDRLFGRILTGMDDVLGFRYSMVLIPDDGAERLRVVASRGYAEPGIGATVGFGKGVIGVAAKKRRVMRIVGLGTQRIYVAAAAHRGATATAAGPPLPGLPEARSQVAIPLVAKDRLLGVYAVESPDHGAFDELDEQFLGIIGGLVATAIDNANAYRAQERLSEAYSRFVPSEFLALLEKRTILDVGLGDQVERDMTVLFSDIRSFTSISERMTPKQNFDFINEFLAQVAPVIRDHGGFIDKYIGDAIMALFPGAPDNALRAALEMQHRLAEHGESFRMGIGIHRGKLMLGIIGFADRMEGTVIADSVNVASRLEGMTKTYGASIIVSEPTLERLERPGEFQTRRLGLAEVKGKHERIAIHELLGASQDP